jgi:hypothetical protein
MMRHAYALGRQKWGGRKIKNVRKSRKRAIYKNLFPIKSHENCIDKKEFLLFGSLGSHSSER